MDFEQKMNEKIDEDDEDLFDDSNTIIEQKQRLKLSSMNA